MTTVNPVGPHAAVYAAMVGPVELLQGEPVHDSASSRDVPAGMAVWCPVCGRRVGRVTAYDVDPRPLTFMDWATTLTVPGRRIGYSLDPCGHYVTKIVWLAVDADPAEVARTMRPAADPLPSETLARRVRRMRTRRLWSMTDAAERMGCSVSMLGAIERGDRTPHLAMLAKIAGAFELSIPELLTRTQHDSKASP